MTSKSRAVTQWGVFCQVAKCELGENGRPDDPQDDVGWQQSRLVMWPSGQSLHAYALYWAIGFSSKGLYLLIPQLTYVAIVDVGLALFQDSYKSHIPWDFYQCNWTHLLACHISHNELWYANKKCGRHPPWSGWDKLPQFRGGRLRSNIQYVSSINSQAWPSSLKRNKYSSETWKGSHAGDAMAQWVGMISVIPVTL
jgi:hypothetical protein